MYLPTVGESGDVTVLVEPAAAAEAKHRDALGPGEPRAVRAQPRIAT
jgi:hypothetical protein